MRRAASDDSGDMEERDGEGIVKAERRGDPSGSDNIFRCQWEAIAKGEKTFVSVFELERKMLIMPRIVHEPGVSKPTNGRILGKQLFDDECSLSAVLSFPLFLLKILLHYDVADVWWIGIDHSLWPPRTVVDHPHPHPLFIIQGLEGLTHDGRGDSLGTVS